LSYVVLCACLKSENGCRKIATKFADWFVQNCHKRGTRRSFAKKVEELCNESGNQDDSILPKSVEKCHVGHPRKFVTTLQFERQIKKEANEEEDVDN
jgi:3-isopropylmalate dehydratase small subunit